MRRETCLETDNGRKDLKDWVEFTVKDSFRIGLHKRRRKVEVVGKGTGPER